MYSYKKHQDAKENKRERGSVSDREYGRDTRAMRLLSHYQNSGTSRNTVFEVA